MFLPHADRRGGSFSPRIQHTEIRPQVALPSSQAMKEQVPRGLARPDEAATDGVFRVSCRAPIPLPCLLVGSEIRCPQVQHG
ncbi:unnamed protein product [Urochloa humidicola]